MAIVVLNSMMKPQERTIEVPKVTVGEYTYNGKPQGPVITNLDSTHIEARDASNTEVGRYALILRLRNRDSMTWTDGSNEDKQYAYEIKQGVVTGNVSTFAVTFNEDSSSEYDVNITNLAGVAPKRAVRITSGIPDDRFTASVVQGTTSYKIHFKITDAGKTSGEWGSEIGVTILGDDNHKDLEGTITVRADYVVKLTFTQATAHQIEKMVRAADAGKLDLAKDCGWAVGQVNSFQVSNWKYSRDGIASVTTTQNYHMALLDTGTNSNYTLASDTRKKPSFVIGIWEESGDLYKVVDATDGSEKVTWSNSILRTKLNDYILTFYKDHLFGNVFKKVRVPYNVDTTADSSSYVEDTLVIPALNEITGNSRYTPDSALKQFTYYVNNSLAGRHTTNALNNFDKNAYRFWTRTKSSGSDYYFYIVVTGGTTETYGSEYPATSDMSIMILAFV